MISTALESFVNQAIDAGHVSADEMRRLARDILADGIRSRDQADMLIALDRAVADKPAEWDAFLLTAIVGFVLGGDRHGAICRETAAWLANSLSCGTGPTPLAVAIAFEAVRSSDLCDEALVTFVMRYGRGRLAGARTVAGDRAAA